MNKKSLLFLLVLFLIGSGNLFAKRAKVQPVDLVYTNPGEDCGNSVRISFHSTENKAVLYYTQADREGYKKAKKLKLKGKENTADFHYHEHFFQFEAELKKLKPNTNYKYKIVVKGADFESGDYFFSTADNDGEFGFLWCSDIHSHPEVPIRFNLTKKIAAIAEEQLNGDMDLIVSTGDEVCYGAFYDHWQLWQGSFLNKKVWAGCPGNHSYYDILDSDGSSVMNGQWFDATQNQPTNGPEEMKTTFWFMYDSILFIALDTVPESYYSQQKKWVENVIKQNEGKYQYIIMYEHYPFVNAYTGAFKGGAAQYSYWQNLFDEFDVDVALSGDSHVYLETKPIYGKKLGQGTKGTVFIGAPQVGERGRDIERINNENLMENRISCSDLAEGSGLSYFKVSKEGLTHVLLDAAGEVRAETFLPAKRPYPVKK